MVSALRGVQNQADIIQVGRMILLERYIVIGYVIRDNRVRPALCLPKVLRKLWVLVWKDVCNLLSASADRQTACAALRWLIHANGCCFHLAVVTSLPPSSWCKERGGLDIPQNCTNTDCSSENVLDVSYPDSKTLITPYDAHHLYIVTHLYCHAVRDISCHAHATSGQPYTTSYGRSALPPSQQSTSDD